MSMEFEKPQINQPKERYIVGATVVVHRRGESVKKGTFIGVSGNNVIIEYPSGGKIIRDTIPKRKFKELNPVPKQNRE